MPEPDVRLLSFPHRGSTYFSVMTSWKKRDIEVTLSPTGRSVHVFVDGEKYTPTWKESLTDED